MFYPFIFPVVHFQLRPERHSIADVLGASVYCRSFVSREWFTVCFTLDEILLHFGGDTFEKIAEVTQNRKIPQDCMFSLEGVVNPNCVDACQQNRDPVVCSYEK